MTNPVFFKRHDYCWDCDSERAIELYDNYGKPMAFSRILDLVDEGKPVNLGNRIFGSMRCTVCAKKYDIDWLNSKEIPKPLYCTISLDNFKRTYRV